MDPLGARQKRIDLAKDAQNKSDASLNRDFFVIIMGLVLTLLVFVLFALVSGRGLEVIFPHHRRTLIGDDGRALDFMSSSFSPGLEQEYVQIGTVLGMIALIIFVSVFVVLHWIKKEPPPAVDAPDAKPENSITK